MTEKERGDFDAIILLVNARASGADMEPHIKTGLTKGSQIGRPTHEGAWREHCQVN
jgi:hypothetical protein